jgi:hypothetical protein
VNEMAEPESLGCLLVVTTYADLTDVIEPIVANAATRIASSPMLGDFIEIRYVSSGLRSSESEQCGDAISRLVIDLTCPATGAAKNYFALAVIDQSAASVSQLLADCAADPVITKLGTETRGFATVDDCKSASCRGQTSDKTWTPDIVLSARDGWTKKALTDALWQYAYQLLTDIASAHQPGLVPAQLASIRAEDNRIPVPRSDVADDDLVLDLRPVPSAPNQATQNEAEQDQAVQGLARPDQARRNQARPNQARQGQLPPTPGGGWPTPDAQPRKPPIPRRPTNRDEASPDTPAPVLEGRSAAADPAAPGQPARLAPTTDTETSGDARPAERLSAAHPGQHAVTPQASNPLAVAWQRLGKNIASPWAAGWQRLGAKLPDAHSAGAQAAIGHLDAGPHAPVGLPPSDPQWVTHSPPAVLLFMSLFGGSSAGAQGDWRRARSVLLEVDERIAAIPTVGYWVRTFGAAGDIWHSELRPAGQLSRRDLRRADRSLDFGPLLDTVLTTLTRDMRRARRSTVITARPAILFFPVTAPLADAVSMQAYMELTERALVLWILSEQVRKLISPDFGADGARTFVDNPDVSEEIADLLAAHADVRAGGQAFPAAELPRSRPTTTD